MEHACETTANINMVNMRLIMIASFEPVFFNFPVKGAFGDM